MKWKGHIVPSPQSRGALTVNELHTPSLCFYLSGCLSHPVRDLWLCLSTCLPLHPKMLSNHIMVQDTQMFPYVFWVYVYACVCLCICVNNVNMHIPVYMQRYKHTFISNSKCYLCKPGEELPVASFFFLVSFHHLFTVHAVRWIAISVKYELLLIFLFDKTCSQQCSGSFIDTQCRIQWGVDFFTPCFFFLLLSFAFGPRASDAHTLL